MIWEIAVGLLLAIVVVAFLARRPSLGWAIRQLRDELNERD